MAIKAIMWDIGGVLERTENPAPRAAIAAQLGWQVDDLSKLVFGHTDNHRIQLGQVSMDEHYANIAAALGIPQPKVGGVIDAFFGGDRLDLALVDHIRAMKQDYTTAVISNYTPILRSHIFNRWQIGDAFDHLIISSEVGVMKPDPAIYQIALEKCDCRPEEAVFIDDFTENVESARQVGMDAILFKSAPQALEELHNLLEQVERNPNHENDQHP